MPTAWIFGLDETSAVLTSNDVALKRQSTYNSSGASANRTLIEDGVAGDEADFARELEKYKTILTLSNLPFTISSSTTATITRRSHCSKTPTRF